MNRHTKQEQLEDLLNQEITDDELRELLKGLGEIELVWSPKTTLKDVVEATSADPVVIGRLLAEIRNEDWEERFGLRLSEVEERVTIIEETVAKPSQPSVAIPFELEEIEDLRSIARERAKAKEQLPLAIFIAIIGALLVVMALYSSVTSRKEPFSPYYEPTVYYNGRTLEESADGVRSRDSIGSRPATPDEVRYFNENRTIRY